MYVKTPYPLMRIPCSLLIYVDFVAFGAHGARTPVTQEGHGLRVIAGVGLVLAVSSGLMYATRAGGKRGSAVFFSLQHHD